MAKSKCFSRIRFTHIQPILKFFTIHAPKPPHKRGGESGTEKMDFPHSDFYILGIGTSHGPRPVSLSLAKKNPNQKTNPSPLLPNKERINNSNCIRGPVLYEQPF